MRGSEKPEVQVMEIRKTVLGPEHSSTLTSMANLTFTYRNHGRWPGVENRDEKFSKKQAGNTIGRSTLFSSNGRPMQLPLHHPQNILGDGSK
jgi:hypothetical protein